MSTERRGEWALAFAKAINTLPTAKAINPLPSPRRTSPSSDARLRHTRRWLPFCQAMSANQTIIKIDAGASTVGGKKGETKL